MFNGLLLAPHPDPAFDLGSITRSAPQLAQSARSVDVGIVLRRSVGHKMAGMVSAARDGSPLVRVDRGSPEV